MKKLLAAFLLFFAINALQAGTKLLRYPHSSDTEIVFSHAGDLYTVAISGGQARKITNSIGLELFPRFSQDGKSIAFIGDYDGNRELYVMPSTGGQPKRLTFGVDVGSLPERMGPDKIVMHWTKEGNIFFRSRHENWHAWTGKLYTISPDGGLPKQVEVPNSGFASLSPDGSKLAYNRIFREFRTWKRYRGGQADDIWIYDLKSKKLENISNNDAQDIIPMWFGNKIYYLSDRDKTMNLFCYDLNSKETKKVTNYTEYDVKFPSLGTKHIAYENGGEIYLLDPATDKSTKVEIEVNGDYPDARKSYKSVANRINGFGANKDGKYAYFAARGDIFTVHAKEGITRNLTNSSNAHDRSPEWSPDGKWLAYISDKSGEDEIYISSPDGSQTIQLTNNARSYRYALEWSPDSKKILTSDKSMTLEYIDIDTKKSTMVHKGSFNEPRDYSWSPDSRWITYSDMDANDMMSIYIYNLENKKSTRVTDGFFSSYNPIFTPGGNYLLFVSDRTWQPTVSSNEWNVSYSNMSKIYGVTLKSDTKSPFLPKYDNPVEEEAKPATDTKESKDKKDANKDAIKEDKVLVEIDFTNIESRIFEFPVDNANYYNLQATANHKLYYTKYISGNRGGAKAYVFDMEEKKENELGDFSSFGITDDQKSIVFAKNSKYYIEKLTDKVDGKNAISTEDMKTFIDRQAEWNQVYNEGWRQMKYHFYDPNMHGVDWDAMKKRYAALLPHVKHRDDLTYIMGELIGELNAGHAYVGGGDAPSNESLNIGLLGCEFEEDKSGFFKISKIFEGRNWEEGTRSPLTEPGVNVKEGEYLIAIDGISVKEVKNPHELLLGKAGKNVKLTINSKANESGTRDVYIKTIANDSKLRYLNWVEANRKYVDEKSNGRIGYIHIPDMGVGNGLTEFFKYFMPQVGKEALVIDDRYNGGGNVSPMVAERLRRELAIVKHKRNAAAATPSPSSIMSGPMVCLINELSASDGDLFPFRFKRHNMGKLIGRRSWGGVVGIYGSLPFLDGGYMMKPEVVNFSPDGEWVLEGTGMTPDIDVDNHPAEVMAGKDAQLDKAIEVLLEEIKNDKKPKVPKLPPYPKKN